MHARIAALVKAEAQMRERRRLVLATVQRTCKHRDVIASPWRAREYFGDQSAMRLCRDCGYEEHAWGWPGRLDRFSGSGSQVSCSDDGVRTELNGPTTAVSFDRLCRERI